MRHLPLREQVKQINAHLRGHTQYFGVPFNSRSLRRLYRYTVKMWRKNTGKAEPEGPLKLDEIHHYFGAPSGTETKA